MRQMPRLSALSWLGAQNYHQATNYQQMQLKLILIELEQRMEFLKHQRPHKISR